MINICWVPTRSTMSRIEDSARLTVCLLVPIKDPWTDRGLRKATMNDLYDLMKEVRNDFSWLPPETRQTHEID